MRIALVDPSLFTLPYDVRLTGGLAACGHAVELHGRPLRDGETLPAGISLRRDFYRSTERLAFLPRPLRLAAKGLDHAASLARLAARLRQWKPDAIHFQWLALPMFDRLLLRSLRRVAPLVLTLHDTQPFNGAPSAGLQLRGYRACLAAFDALIVHTEQGRQRCNDLALSAGRIAVIPHGLLHAPAPARPEPADGILTFLLFGKIKPYKGADLAIAAFAALPEALRAKARLRIVGQPHIDLAALHRAARSLGGGVSIETGFVAEADIPALFAPGTVALFPYREIEASGVMFMALAYGRPIIASRLGSFAETLQDRVHGRLVPPDDPIALTGAMAGMIADREFTVSAAGASRRLALEMPGWDIIGRRTAQLYAALSRGHPPTAWRGTRAAA